MYWMDGGVDCLTVRGNFRGKYGPLIESNRKSLALRKRVKRESCGTLRGWADERCIRWGLDPTWAWGILGVLRPYGSIGLALEKHIRYE